MKSKEYFLWEAVGMFAGFSVSGLILFQILTDFYEPLPSTVSVWYCLGFVLICGFWTAYGVVHKRLAIWSTNLLATILQGTFGILILMGV